MIRMGYIYKMEVLLLCAVIPFIMSGFVPSGAPLSIDVIDPTATGVAMSLQLNLTLSNTLPNVSCIYEWGDNEGVSFHEFTELQTGSYTRSYTDGGYYDVTIQCMNEESISKAGINAYVGDLITELSGTGGTSDLILNAPHPVTANFTLSVSFATGTDVDITVEILVSGYTDNQTGLDAGSHDILLPKEQFADTGMYAVTINASNPLTTSPVSISVVIAVLTPVNVTSVAFSPPGYAENPTFVMVDTPFDIITIFYGDDVILTFEITYDNGVTNQTWAIEGSYCEGQVQIHTFNYTFNITGKFYIAMQASNYINSYENPVITVEAIYGVNGFTTAMTDETTLLSDSVTSMLTVDSGALTPMDIVICNIQYGNGNSENITFDYTASLTSTSESTAYGYTDIGHFMASITCYNKLPTHLTSARYISHFYIIVVNPVANLELTHDSVNASHHPYSKAVTFVVKLQDPANNPQLPNLTCVFNFGSSEAVQNETGDATSTMNIMTMKSRFSQGEKSYTITVNCSNELTFQVLTVEFYVYYDCWIKSYFDEIFRNIANPRTTLTNKLYELKGDVKLANNSECIGPLLIQWKLFDSSDNEVQPPITLPNTSSIDIPPHSFDNRTYKFQLSTSFTGMTPQAEQIDFTYLRFDMPNLVAIITDGQYSSVTRSTVISATTVIDSSSSYDPADDPNQTQDWLDGISILREWTCMKGTPQTTEADITTYLITQVLPTGFTSCPDSALPGGNNQDIYELPPNTLDLEIWYIYELVYSRSDRSVKATQAILAYDKPKLSLEFECKMNCYSGNAMKHKLRIDDLQLNIAIRNEDVDNSSAVYEWKFETFNSGSWVDITDEIQGPTDSTGILISKDTLDNYARGTKFQISCTVTLLDVDDYGATKLTQQYVTNYPPYNGNCTIDRTEATAALDNICVQCFGWKDEGQREDRNELKDDGGALTYSILQRFFRENSSEINPAYLDVPLETSRNLQQCIKIQLPPDGNNFTMVEVRVKDVLVLPSANVQFSVKVVPPISADASGENGADLVNNLYDTTSKAINGAMEVGDYESAISNIAATASCLTMGGKIEELNIDPEVGAANAGLTDQRADGTPVSNSEAFEDTKKKKVDDTAASIRLVKANLASVVSTALSKFSEEKKDSPSAQSAILNSISTVTSGSENGIDNRALTLAANVLTAIVERFGRIAEKNGDSADFNVFFQESVVTLGKLSNAISPDDESNLKGITDLSQAREMSKSLYDFGTEEEKAKKDDLLLTDEERVFYLFKRQQVTESKSTERRELGTEQSLRIDQALGNALANVIPSDGAVVQVGDFEESPAVTTMTRLTPEKAKNATLAGKQVSVTLPYLETPGKVSVGIYEGSTVVNTDESARFATITSKEVHLEIQMQTQDMTGTITMEFKVEKVAYEIVDLLVFTNDADKLHRQRILVNSPDDMVCVVVKPTSVRVAGYKVWISSSDEVSKLNYDAEELLSDANLWTTCFLPTQLNMKSAGICRYGIETIFKDTSASSTSRRRRSATNSTEPLYPAINTTAATMACMVLDENRVWKSDQCAARWLADEGRLICECIPQRKMTFANSFYVPPNSIDFGSVFLKFSPLNQAAVMGTLGGIFIIYILVIIWARRKDRKDLLKWGITPLSDNFAEDNYFYVIRVYTGMRPGAGTKSKVGFVVAGEEMDTGVRELADGVRKEFTTGSVMNFLMSTTMCLGDLEYIRVWHDNSGAGNSASWYISKLEIQDVQRNETFTFLVERWLAVEKEDGLLECIVPVCKVENLNIFRNRFYINAKDNLAESHIWVSVMYRPQTSHFTRVQRATCAFVFLMLTMISNAMFFRGSENYETPATIQVGPFRFTMQQIYISLICALITTPATLVLIYLFKLSRPKPVVDKTLFGKSSRAKRYKIPIMESWLEKQQRKSMELEQSLISKGYPKFEGFSLPHKMVYVAWFLSFLTALLSGFFIMLYSMEWGKQKSEEWLTTFFLTFFESVFCLDPIKIAVMAVVFAILVRSAQDVKSVIDRSTIMRRYKSNLRGKSGGIRLPSPPLDTEKLENARAKRETELKMKTAVKDVFINVFIIWILFSLSFGTRDIWSYNMHQEIVDSMLKPPNQMSFYDIKTINEYFDWLNNTAINNLFPEEDMTGGRLHWRLRQFLQDGAKFRVGPPRLRQLRTTKETCNIPNIGKENCYRKYTETIEETGSYCIGWNSTKPCHPDEKVYMYSSDAWKFTSAFDIWGFPISGYYTTYGGGGYISKLSVNREVSHLILQEIYSNSWIDRQTRAVLFEFTLYCLNANIFTYNIFMAEFPETGGVFPYVMILPLRVYMHIGALGMYILACEIIFLIYLVIMTVMTGVQIYQQKKAFFKKPWQVYDFIFIILSYTAMAMYFVRYALVTESLAVFQEDKKAFVNFYHIALWDQVLVLLVGVLAFMAVLRLLNTFGYNKRVNAVVKVFSNAAHDLIWFGIFFLNVFMCYAVFGYLLFGANLKSYKNVYSTMGTLFISMIGKSRFTEIEATDPIFSKIYFMIFIFFVVYMILTMFLAVLSKSIDQVHQDVKSNKGDEMVDYVINKFKGFLSYNKKSNKKSAGVMPQPPAPWSKTTRWTDIDNRAILEDIRMSLHEAILFDPEGLQKKSKGKPLSMKYRK